MLTISQTDTGRRFIHVQLAKSALLFAASCVVIYEFQAMGYGAFLRSVANHVYSPLWWALFAVFMHACVQLFRYYDPRKRRRTVDRFFRANLALYALALGLLSGYVGGSLDRFMESRAVMAHGNALHAELARQMQAQGAYSAEQLRQSEAFQRARRNGVQVQVLPAGESLGHIVEADLTLYVGPDEFYVIVLYDLPIFLTNAVGESRIFQRRDRDAHWSKQYLKPGQREEYVIVDKA